MAGLYVTAWSFDYNTTVCYTNVVHYKSRTFVVEKRSKRDRQIKPVLNYGMSVNFLPMSQIGA